jgi:hypothetical protein
LRLSIYELRMICVCESCGVTGLRLAAEKHVVVTLIRGVEGVFEA